MHRENSFAMQEKDQNDMNPPTSGKSESEEEDYESFFLQPATSPYNMKEKIAKANAQLLQESVNEAKCIRIQFHPTLVDFEPDLTDDDVQSIESYTEEVLNVNDEIKYVLENNLCNIIEEEIIEESIFETIIELNHQQQCAEEADAEEDIIDCTSPVSEEIEDVIGIEEVDEIEEIEELYLEPPDNIEEITGIIEECPEVPVDIPTPEKMEKIQSISENSPSETVSLISPQTTRKTAGKHAKKQRLPHEINCKKHCIEELESRLDLCISKLQLNEKASRPKCPTLRLHRRNCCLGGCKIEQKLPIYKGVHSEYGLSSIQLARQAKRKEKLKLKEEKERELSEAYRCWKMQQNEIIFRQWLKDISLRRNVERNREKEMIRIASSRNRKNYSSSSAPTSQHTSSDIKETQEKVGEPENQGRLASKSKEKQQKVLRARPKTANCITSVQLSVDEDVRRMRPQTSSSSTARIYIEIPERLLDEGVNLGELFIRQLHRKNRNGNGNEGRTFNTNSRKRLDIITKT